MACGRGGAAVATLPIWFCGFLALWGMGVEENRGVAIFLYTFFGKMGEDVEENRGVAIFLYAFFGKMGEDVDLITMIAIIIGAVASFISMIIAIKGNGGK